MHRSHSTMVFGEGRLCSGGKSEESAINEGWTPGQQRRRLGLVNIEVRRWFRHGKP